MDAAPLYPPPTMIARPDHDTPLAEWERDALRKLRLLRAAKKTAILFVTENGTIQIFRGERAGLVP